MPETCAFPNCSRIAQKNSLCIGHRIYASDFPTAIIKEQMEAKPRQQVNKVSEKRKKVNRELGKIVKGLIAGDAECKIKSPVCTWKAIAANHIQKRSPKNIVKLENLEECCAECNTFIENNVEWAVENGHQVSRFAK